MILSHIVAASKNRVIGVKNQLPWHIPEDLKFFKETTINHPIIMGRKTYESIGKKPLPNRLNLVVSHSLKEAPGFLCFESIEDAIKEARKLEDSEFYEIFIVGGGEIYKQTIDQVDRIYYTEVDQEIENGEAFYPEIPSSFKQVKKDQRDGFTFFIYERV